MIPSPTHAATTESDLPLARDSSLNQRTLARDNPIESARDQEFALREAAHVKARAPAPLARDKARTPKALPRGKVLTRDQELALDDTSDSSAVTRDKAPVPEPVPRGKADARDLELPLDQARDPSALARDKLESDSDSDGVVIGRPARSNKGKKAKQRTQLNSDEPIEGNKTSSAVNNKGPFVEITKKKRGKKRAAKEESPKNQIKDGGDQSCKAEGMFDPCNTAA